VTGLRASFTDSVGSFDSVEDMSDGYGLKIAGIVRLGGVLERTSEEFGLPESPNGPARRTSSQHSLKSRYEQSGETVGEAVFGSAEFIHRKRPQALAAYVDDPDEATRESSP
jgi:hypothetical protein